MSRSTIAWLYRYRWGIETGFRSANQLAGLKDCQSRKARAQENHFALILLAHCFLVRMGQADESCGETLDRMMHRPLASDGTVAPAKARRFKPRRVRHVPEPHHDKFSALCA